jgi:hypothetical protein
VSEPSPAPPQYARRYRWDAIAAVVASLIGLLALLVSGYTAYIERQQVRAQVWPYLLVGYSDPAQAIVVLNKGAGPALVRSVQLLVDGKPQRNWKQLLTSIGTQGSDENVKSTLNGNVLAPGETLEFLHMPDLGLWQHFRAESRSRLMMRVCYCSSLGDCWLNADRDDPEQVAKVQPVDACPRLEPEAMFDG